MAVCPEAHGGVSQGSMAATTASLKTEQVRLRVAKQATLLRIQHLQHQLQVQEVRTSTLKEAVPIPPIVQTLYSGVANVKLMGMALQFRSCVICHISNYQAYYVRQCVTLCWTPISATCIHWVPRRDRVLAHVHWAGGVGREVAHSM
jgi:hypothetical protein